MRRWGRNFNIFVVFKFSMSTLCAREMRILGMQTCILFDNIRVQTNTLVFIRRRKKLDQNFVALFKWHYFPRSIKCFPSVIVVICYDNMFIIIAKWSDFKGNDVYILYFALLAVVLYYNIILYCTLCNCIRLHCTAPVTLPTFSLFLYSIYVDRFIRSA